MFHILWTTLLAMAWSPSSPPSAIDRRIDPTTWITAEDYPAIALRRGDTGTVGVRVRIGGDGKARNCVVTDSSGSALLDATTCALVEERGRYAPPTEVAAMAGTAEDMLRFTWRMPDTGTTQAPILPAGKLFAFEVGVEVDPSGVIGDCSVVRNVGATPLSPSSIEALCRGISASIRPAPGSDGKAVAGRLRVSVDYEPH